MNKYNYYYFKQSGCAHLRMGDVREHAAQSRGFPSICVVNTFRSMVAAHLTCHAFKQSSSC